MTITAPVRTLTPWLPLAPCEPVTCVAPARRPAGVLRQAARLTGAVLVLLAGVVLAPRRPVSVGRTPWPG